MGSLSEYPRRRAEGAEARLRHFGSVRFPDLDRLRQRITTRCKLPGFHLLERLADDSNVHLANLTLHYNVMPYVGLLTSGVAATAQGEVAIPKRDS